MVNWPSGMVWGSSVKKLPIVRLRRVLTVLLLHCDYDKVFLIELRAYLLSNQLHLVLGDWFLSVIAISSCDLVFNLRVHWEIQEAATSWGKERIWNSAVLVPDGQFEAWLLIFIDPLHFHLLYFAFGDVNQFEIRVTLFLSTAMASKKPSGVAKDVNSCQFV